MKGIKTALVYGGNTIIGKNVIKRLNANKWRTLNFDETENPDANKNFPPSQEFQDHLSEFLRGEKIDSLLCFAGFPKNNNDEIAEIDARVEFSVHSTEFASEFLKKRGVMMIPTCIPPDPESLQNDEIYSKMGLVTNSLVFFKWLAEQGQYNNVNQLPEGSRVIGLVPQKLDQKQIDVISSKIVEWTEGFDTPDNGKILWMNKDDQNDVEIKEF